MIDKVKQWFGIEGVKIELILPEATAIKSGIVAGRIQFTSMHQQSVQSFQLKLIEVYTRGRRGNKVTTEYQLGEILINKDFIVPAEQPIMIDFRLPFELMKSEIDEMGDRNMVLGGIAKLARFSRGASSTYRVECEANVKGTRLSPFDKQVIVLK